MNKQLTQQNLRELAKLTFLNLMSANGVMAKTIIRNYKQKQEREKMSECNKCGITDHEITPKQIKEYLGEKPDNNILDQQTDKMFFFVNEDIVCRMCDLK
tara:strand:+ start:366 stop:665 length:300 start_codon:yes stop_codon:yes gene_type:complete